MTMCPALDAARDLGYYVDLAGQLWRRSIHWMFDDGAGGIWAVDDNTMADKIREEKLESRLA